MTDIPKLDVTKIAPMHKHATIYEHFDALKAGEAFIIHSSFAL